MIFLSTYSRKKKHLLPYLLCTYLVVCVFVCVCAQICYSKVTMRNPISVVLPHCCKTCPNESRPVLQETFCLIGRLISLHPHGLLIWKQSSGESVQRLNTSEISKIFAYSSRGGRGHQHFKHAYSMRSKVKRPVSKCENAAC